jgi:hypothetical protein
VVPLDTFNASFVQLPERCKVSQPQQVILKEINTIFSLFHAYVCILNDRVLELYCLISYTAQQKNTEQRQVLGVEED